jgi:DNA gyrase/topoisomerase IV subunit A
MDTRGRQEAEDRLAVLETLLIAQERRHDVIEIVWAARDQHEAGVRLKELLGLEAGIPPGIVLDMQISRLTSESRDGIATDVSTSAGCSVASSTSHPPPTRTVMPR